MSNLVTQRNGSIQYGDTAINFSIEPRTTDVPKVLIKVHPDCWIVSYITHTSFKLKETAIG